VIQALVDFVACEKRTPNEAVITVVHTARTMVGHRRPFEPRSTAPSDPPARSPATRNVNRQAANTIPAVADTVATVWRTDIRLSRNPFARLTP
jgi:hypothetical protein